MPYKPSDSLNFGNAHDADAKHTNLEVPARQNNNFAASPVAYYGGMQYSITHNIKNIGNMMREVKSNVFI